MNFLAHAYLSFRQPGILTGNLISDFVKGKSRYTYPEDIQKGIALHRAIDQFTDEHRVNAVAKAVFRPAVGLYAGAFVDVAYDHFLAKDPLAFPADTLPHFSQWVYGELEQRLDVCPPKFQAIFPYMHTQDWLLRYREREGIRQSMAGLARRAQYLDSAEAAWAAFDNGYEQLEHCYQRFFPELMLFVNNYFRKHLLLPPPASQL